MASDESKKVSGRRRDELSSGRQLCVGMAGVACGAIVGAAGIGRLFISDREVDLWARSLLGAGALVLALSITVALRGLRELPRPADDCARYGRHIVGLTFALLVTGLCNAAGMCTLALEGGLGFSANSVIDASNEKKIEEADDKRSKARDAQRNAEREERNAATVLARAQSAKTEACADHPATASAAVELPGLPSGSGSDAPPPVPPKPDPCKAAADAVWAAEDNLVLARDRLADANEDFSAKESACAEKRRALFFLLSVSTMTALFGAAFYVVNQVRAKRPPYTPAEPGSGFGGLGTHGAGANGSREIATITATATVQGSDEAAANKSTASVASGFGSAARANGEAATGTAPLTTTAQMSIVTGTTAEEPFDVHKFWSGAFFRVGEAVLFTFTFFWLLWSSRSTEYAIWLPVLALFVGMFVKTGETIVFSLGQRILSAAEALLPTGPSDHGRAATAGPNVGDATAAGSPGAFGRREAKAQPQAPN